jgi:MFS family permease
MSTETPAASSATPEEQERARLQKRTVRVLTASQVLGGVGVGSGVAVVGLLAYDLSGTAALSGVSATASTIGAAIAALVIARIAIVRGRRPGLVTGYMVGAGGAALAIVAAMLGVFWLHVVSSIAFGWSNASNLQARYAATDLAPENTRARALSTVVWATTIGAVLGPNLTGVGGQLADTFGLHPLSGSYLFSFVSFLSAALVQLIFLRPDPLVVVREALKLTPSPPPIAQGWGSALRLIRSIPQARTALYGITAAHATMVGIMVMSPVHMEHYGATLQLVGFVISAHIFGMWAFSPIVGWLADHYGRRTTLFAGLAQLAVSAVMAATLTPTGRVLFPLGLLLLGSGWSFCLISSSTMLTSAVETADRPAVQGVSDLAMNLAGALGGTLAGIVLAIAGYPILAFGALVLLIAPTVSALRLRDTP